MSTPRPVSLQWYDNRGVPVSPTWDRVAMNDFSGPSGTNPWAPGA
jgi:hypothetical protein